jgi:hypothetical protein
MQKVIETLANAEFEIFDKLYGYDHGASLSDQERENLKKAHAAIRAQMQALINA